MMTVEVLSFQLDLVISETFSNLISNSVIPCFLLPLTATWTGDSLNLSGMDLYSLDVFACGRQLHLPTHTCASGCFQLDSTRQKFCRPKPDLHYCFQFYFQNKNLCKTEVFLFSMDTDVLLQNPCVVQLILRKGHGSGGGEIPFFFFFLSCSVIPLELFWQRQLPELWL